MKENDYLLQPELLCSTPIQAVSGCSSWYCPDHFTSGSVLLTFYPNFNLSLQDNNLSTALKVQVQIQGAEQISSVKMATLHHQLVYRLQNHVLDLPTPNNHFDALMVLAESDQIPTII